MKKLIFIFILAFGFISCSSDDETQNIIEETPIDFSELIGKWNWVSFCGGVTGACAYPDEDYFYTIEFKEDLTYIKVTNGALIEEVGFTINEINDIETYYLYSISFEDGSNDVYWVHVHDGYLSISAGERGWLYEPIND